MKKFFTKEQDGTIKYECPYCSEFMTEDELWSHCPRYHGDEDDKKVCPICVANGGPKEPVGSRSWGYSSHLHETHGPPSEKLKAKKMKENTLKPTYCFSLVIVQNPKDGKFVLVKEGCKKGYWLPAGRVDPGETFQEAALRETMEEAGLKVTLKGILKIEYRPFPSGGARQRIIFYAHPADPDQIQLKTIPDFESLGAIWISHDDFMKKVNNGELTLRGYEPLIWFDKVSKGCAIHPISLLGNEE